MEREEVETGQSQNLHQSPCWSPSTKDSLTFLAVEGGTRNCERKISLLEDEQKKKSTSDMPCISMRSFSSSFSLGPKTP